MNSIKKHLLITLLLASLSTFAQSSYIARWGYTFGNTCYSHNVLDIKTDQNGNHITTGTLAGFDVNSGLMPPDLDPSSNTFTLNPSLSNDFYIAKYDTDGNFISAFVIGSTGVDICNSIAVDNGNNIIATGKYRVTVDFDPSAVTNTVTSNGLDDIFLAKYTNSGTLIWIKTIGGSGNDNGVKVITDNQNNIFLTGTFNGTVDIDPSATTNTVISNGVEDVFIAKFDANGNLINAKAFGGSSAETIVDMVLDQDKKLYMTGTFSTTVDFDPHPLNSFPLTDVGSYGDTYISKFDSSLSFQWVKQLTCSRTNYPKDINIDNTGNILMAGYYSILPLDLDPSAFATFTVSSPGKNDFGYISKYDNSGNFMWGGVYEGVSQFGGEVLSAVSIWSDNTGDIHTVGKYAGSVDFDLSPSSTYTLDNQTYAPSVFYAKYSNSGAFINVKRLSTAFIYPNTAHVDSQGSLLMAGNINNYGVNIDPTGSNPLNLYYNNVCNNIYYGFISKHNTCNTPTITSVSSSTNIICASNTITLSIAGALNDAIDWQWAKNSCTSNTIGLGSSIVVTPTANTTYNVKGIGGCAGKFLACNTVSISTIPQPTITITPSSFTVCPNKTFTLTANGANSYTWTNGSTSSLNTYSTSISATYSVAGTNTLGCINSKTISIGIYTIQPLNIVTTPYVNKDTICKGEPISFFASGAASNSYTWTSPAAGSTYINNGTTGLNVYNLDTTSVFVLNAINNNNCPVSASYTIIVEACVGIKEYDMQENSVNVFPNPANHILNFTINNTQINKTIIYNNLSQPVFEKSIKENTTQQTINIDLLPKGFYTIIFYDNEKPIVVKKIIKE